MSAPHVVSSFFFNDSCGLQAYIDAEQAQLTKKKDHHFSLIDRHPEFKIQSGCGAFFFKIANWHGFISWGTFAHIHSTKKIAKEIIAKILGWGGGHSPFRQKVFDWGSCMHTKNHWCFAPLSKDQLKIGRQQPMNFCWSLLPHFFCWVCKHSVSLERPFFHLNLPLQKCPHSVQSLSSPFSRHFH